MVNKKAASGMPGGQSVTEIDYGFLMPDSAGEVNRLFLAPPIRPILRRQRFEELGYHIHVFGNGAFASCDPGNLTIRHIQGPCDPRLRVHQRL